MSKAHISLDGSEHRDVYLKLKKSGDVDEEGSEDRLADLIFDGDGQKISLRMMESDARALGIFLLKNTSHSLDGNNFN